MTPDIIVRKIKRTQIVYGTLFIVVQQWVPEYTVNIENITMHPPGTERGRKGGGGEGEGRSRRRGSSCTGSAVPTDCCVSA